MSRISPWMREFPVPCIVSSGHKHLAFKLMTTHTLDVSGMLEQGAKWHVCKRLLGQANIQEYGFQ